jgi:anti-sigma-K factor RskA
LIAGYVLGDLDPEEAGEFAQLLAENPAIAAEVAQMQKALEITHAPPEIAPPVPLRAAILNAAITPEPLAQPAPSISPATAPPSRERRRSQFPWGRALGSAAAVMLVALGISNYALWQRLQAVQTVAPPIEPITVTLKPAQATTTATATIVVNPKTLEAELAVQDLPPLPSGKVYALWTVLVPNAPVTTDSKQAILTDVFTVDAQGSAKQTVTLPAVYRSSKNLVTKVAVTVEDAATPQAHVGSPILIASL